MPNVVRFLDRLQNRRAAYRGLFLDERGQATRAAAIVMADLMRFCRARTSTVVVSNGRVDPIAMGLAEGRREVWNRIQMYLNLSDRALQVIADEENG
jgi:hypothetical protein